MKRILPIVKKELKTYFNSPIAYIVVIAFLVFTSVWFFYIQQFFTRNIASLRSYFSIMPIVFVIILPALTMRNWAEEHNLGTSELLLTLPFKEAHVVIGKFLGTFLLLLMMIGLTLPVPLTVRILGDFETGQILGEYFGLIFLGAAGIAIGQFISSLTSNQIVAFIAGMLVLLFMTLVNQINVILNLPAAFAAVLNYLSLDYHYQSFIKGILDSRDLLYFILIAVLFNYLNVKVLIFRKWS